MNHLIKRNLLIFFKSRLQVFYAFLGVIVIIVLYILFLGDALFRSGEELLGYRSLIDSWIMAGIISVTSITTMLSSLGNMIVDTQYKVYKDFVAAPLKRSQILLGYIVSSFIISLLLTICAFIFAEFYIVSNGGSLLSPIQILQVLGIIVYNVFLTGFIFFVIVYFIDTVHTFSFLSTLVGSLIGFLMGIYIPIGDFPESVQMIIKIFPPAHGCMILRKIMMSDGLTKAFAVVPVDYRRELEISLGSIYMVGDMEITTIRSLLYMGIMMAIFAGISFAAIKKVKK